MNEHRDTQGVVDVDRISGEIRSLIAEISEVPEEQITDGVPFADLHIDSLMALEIVAHIEKKYRIHIAEEDLQRVKSFGDTIALVSEHLAR